MPERVVDQLVAVEVDIEHRGRLTHPENVFQLMRQIDAVGQAGQGIVQRRVDQPLLGVLSLQVKRHGSRQNFGQLHQQATGLKSGRTEKQHRRQHVASLIQNRGDEGGLLSQLLGAVAGDEARFIRQVGQPDCLAA